MNKEPIIILAYYFPPCNLTPSERIYSFAHYLSRENYYPIVITKDWENEKNLNVPRIEYFNNFEVHFIGINNSLKDKLFKLTNGKKSYFLYLILAFFSSLFDFLFVRQTKYWEFYLYLSRFLVSNNKINKLIVSCSPFELMAVAYKLSKKFNIKWIADYRDDWSTNQMQYSDNIPKKIVKHIHSIFEKKWMSNAQTFVTVSEYYRFKISAFLKIKGHVLTNGFIEENYNNLTQPFHERFTLCYLGALYPMQPIEKFISGVILFIKTNNLSPSQINIAFIGSAENNNVRIRINKSIKGFEQYFELTKRLNKKEVILFLQKSHLLFTTCYGNSKGIPGSKLYEYLALQKQVILYPNDHDIIEETLTKTGLGLICNDENDLLNHLKKMYLKYKNNESLSSEKIDLIEIKKYTRENQTKVLLKILNDL